MISLGSVGLHQEILTSLLPVNQTVKQLAIQLFGSYRVLVVLAAIMLLAALVSAIHITKQGSNSAKDPEPDTEAKPAHNLGSSEFTPDVSVNDITKQGSTPHSASPSSAKDPDPDTEAERAPSLGSSEFTLAEIEPSQAQTNKQTRGEHR